MDSRQKQLLKHIIEEHIKTALPVGSNLLVSKHFNEISSATVRNEMADLEHQGLIAQPHTSAGRVPTEKGYKFYIESYIKNQESKEIRELKKIEGVKKIAKKIAEISSEAVILSFSKDDVYYTGISNVFSQPEFHSYNLAYNFTSIIDHLDEVVFEIYDQITSNIEVKIGSESPFGAECGSILTKTKGKMLGIIGPMRMDYRRNINLIKYAVTLL